MRRDLVVFVAVAVIVELTAAQRLPLQFEVRPLFGTTVPPYGCLPLKITIRNEGHPVDAILVVSSSHIRTGRRYLFPLSLPTGSKKEVLAFPFVTHNTMNISFRLEGVKGVTEQTIPVISSDDVRLVVTVGDEIGGLEWLRKLNPQPSPPSGPGPAPVWRPGTPIPNEWVWAYCRPEDLPNKAGALTGVSALVLGTGSERLTMSQWQAIRRWVTMGGVLIVPGGSAAVYLRHVVLASLLPIKNCRTVQWSDWSTLTRWLQVQPPSETAFITVGELTSNSKLIAGTKQLPLVAVRPHGYGAVVFVAFNLWDKPFRSWQGLPNLWHRAVVPLTKATVAHLWANSLPSLGQWQGWYRYSPPPPLSSIAYSNQPPPLPFKLELPSVLNLAFVLLTYFAIVVPISYNLLRRRRVLDLHWFIAPVFSLLFVFIVGQATFGLHHLGTQNLTRGLVVVAAGESDGYLFAGVTLFIQRAGNYLLDFGNAEAVFAQIHDDGDMISASDLETQEGPTISTVLRVPNLSFRLLYFAKPISLNGTVDVQAQKQRNSLKVTVTNRLPFTLKKVQCKLVSLRQGYERGYWYGAVIEEVISLAGLPDLAPQGSFTSSLSVPLSPVRSQSLVYLVVSGEVEGIDITPNLSVPSHRKSYVTLQVTRDLH